MPFDPERKVRVTQIKRHLRLGILTHSAVSSPSNGQDGSPHAQTHVPDLGVTAENRSRHRPF